MDTLTQFSDSFKFTESENRTLKFWQENDVYRRICEQNNDGCIFKGHDGPPFCNAATLHTGHVHIGMMKSTMVNFKNMHGHNVANKIGYDSHGLPLEQVVNRLLSLSTNKDVKQYGLANYNQKCEETVNSFAGSWQPIYNRIGRFLDFKNEYKTLDCSYMESVWWVWKQLWNKGLVYKGHKIMPYSTECGTALSISEASGDDVYKDVTDPAIYIKFKLLDKENTYFVVWTTTSWTLPSNLGLAVNSKFTYVKVKDSTTNEHYILAESCLKNLYKPTKKQDVKQYEIIESFLGEQLKDVEYEPLFNYFAKDRKFKVIAADFVTQDSGTGIVHLAPAFGADDFDACIANNIVDIKEIGNFCPIDENGFVIEPVTDYVGQKILSTNIPIIERLKSGGKLIKKEMYTHSYPHCWRTDTPLIYKAVSSFFIKVTDLKDDLIKNNDKVNWVPEHVGQKRFKLWLENAKDWGVSRSRFFGTPIPVWISDDGEEMQCIGSIDELVELARLTERPTNLHPQYIQHIKIPSKCGKGMLSCTLDLFDCWFESGCVPIAQAHYPFENSNIFDDKEYLSEFICEAIDQCRGWFYTLMVISTALFNKPAFKNVICSGLILADDGKKFSKRLGNYVDPLELCNTYGADAIRLYLTGSPAAHGDAFQFNVNNIRDINGKYIQWLNALKFLIEHTIKFQKDGNVFALDAYKTSTNIMDLWIISRVKTLLINVEMAMNSYMIYKVKPEILDFIEDFTNWYIKFNRNRLRGRFCHVDEQCQALSVLHFVSLMFVKIAAPFVPFLTEAMYEKLKVYLPKDEQKMSVHMCSYPNVNEFLNDSKVERSMKRLQMVAGMVRKLRSKSTSATSVKMPVRDVMIVNDDPEFLDDLKMLERYMCEEINALHITYEVKYGFVRYHLELNNRELGLKFRNKLPEVKSYLTKLLQEDIAEYSKTGILKFDDVVLDFSLVSVSKTRNVRLGKNEMSINENQTDVIVDFEQDNSVMEAYITRLFIVAVQKMRKQTKLRPWNKIGIYYETYDFMIYQVLNKKADLIKQELLYGIDKMENRNMEELVVITDKHEIANGSVLITITSK
jgi:isoleucyl-tRNA synthetase